MRTLAWLFATLCLGSVIGYNIASPGVEVKVVERVETKTVTETETITEAVVPDICLKAYEQAAIIADKSPRAFSALSQVKDLGQAAQVAIVLQDSVDLLDIRNKAHEMLNSTLKFRMEINDAGTRLTRYVDECKAEMEKVE